MSYKVNGRQCLLHIIYCTINSSPCDLYKVHMIGKYFMNNAWYVVLHSGHLIFNTFVNCILCQILKIADIGRGGGVEITQNLADIINFEFSLAFLYYTKMFLTDILNKHRKNCEKLHQNISLVVKVSSCFFTKRCH